jgi:hypothetical protein
MKKLNVIFIGDRAMGALIVAPADSNALTQADVKLLELGLANPQPKLAIASVQIVAGSKVVSKNSRLLCDWAVERDLCIKRLSGLRACL